MKETSIVFIGAGNLAVNLATALHGKGFRIIQVYSRTEASAKFLAEKVNAGWVTDLDGITNKALLYIVSLKDAAFVDLLPQIVKDKEQALLVHTAGSVPMNIWENTVSRYGVLYPLQTFSKRREADFSSIPFFIEANGVEDVKLLKAIASTLTDKVYEADSRQRGSLHLAAVFACNFTNHMYVLSADLLRKHKLPFEVLLPLIDETANKVHELSPIQAQTGPAVRYDENVINKHLDMLSDEQHMKTIYQMLSESIYQRSQEETQKELTDKPE